MIQAPDTSSPDLPEPGALPPVRPSRWTVDERARLAASAAIVAAVVVAALLPSLRAPFEFIDDFEVLAATSAPATAARQFGDVPDLRSALARDLSDFGRLRPVYQALRFSQIGVMGADPESWHALVVALAVAASLLFMVGAWRLGAPPEMAALGALLMALAPGAVETWIRIAPSEASGTLFLAVALACAAPWRGREVRSDALLGLGLVLAAGTKESYVMAVPAVLGLRLVAGTGAPLTARVVLRELRRPVYLVPLAWCLLLGLGSVAAALTGGDQSYGGRSLSGEDLGRRLRRILERSAVRWELWVPPLLAGVAAATLRIPGRRRFGAVVGICLVLGVAPQILLYGTRDFWYPHYWYPLVLFASLATVAGTTLLWRWRHAAGAVVAAVLLLGAALPQARSAFIEAEEFRAKWTAAGLMLDEIARVAPRGGALLVAGPLGEYSISLPFFLEARGRGDIRLFAHPVAVGAGPAPVLEPSNPMTRTYAGVTSDGEGGDDPCSWDRIVLFTRNREVAPLDCPGHEVRVFQDSLALPSFRRLSRFTTPGPAFRMLVRVDGSDPTPPGRADGSGDPES